MTRSCDFERMRTEPIPFVFTTANLVVLQNYVYRLTITDRQVVDYVFPLGGQRGTTVDVALLGQAAAREILPDCSQHRR